MVTYKITRTHTCPYIASRNNESIKTTLHSNLCLNDAYDILLNMFNQQFDTCFNNWGLAVISTNRRHDSACKTSSDKTRRYDYDSRIYQIEVEEP